MNELELAQSREGAMARFVALAAHELRAPAAVVHGVASTWSVRPELREGDKGEALAQMLVEQSERLVRLLDQLLDLSRLDADTVRIERRQVDVRPQLEQLVSSVAGERAGEVELAVADDLTTHVDPDALDRIVGNLVTNALRYGVAPIRLAAEQADRHFRVTVEDRGLGVKPELRGRLFERFVRDTAGQGTGLGLAIAQSYAQAHGGSVLYEPAEPGSRFRVVLPAPPPA